MKLSTFLRWTAILSGLGLSAYLASWWLHTNTFLGDYLSSHQLFGIIAALFLVGALVIWLWPTWYRRLAGLIVLSILGAEAVRWLGLAYVILGKEPPTWILEWFGPASGATASAAFLCVAVLACLDYLVKYGRTNQGFPQGGQTNDAHAQPKAEYAPLSPAEAKARSRYLRELKEDIEARLSESIHSARFIDLGIVDNPTATRLPFRYKSPGQQEFDHIEEAFETYQQRMLILGAPGSGKTTTLLHIVKQLIAAADDPDAPIPLLVNLSKFNLRPSKPWFQFFDKKSDRSELSKDRGGEFERWLEGEFARFPGVTRELANKWIAEQRVAVLLDGLDEVDDEYRFQLVDVLNACRLFQMDVPVVLCSRIHEYEAIQSRGSRLHLSGAVTLQPLTPEQIDDYLDTARAVSLKQALPDDDALYDMARTPLTLSMMTLAYGAGQHSEEFVAYGPAASFDGSLRLENATAQRAPRSRPAVR